MLSWVLSLPMRNWNTVQKWLLNQIWFSFESTYEELKQGYSKRMCIEDIVLSLPMRNWNSQSSWQPRTRAMVLSLPMRNWNIGIPCFFAYSYSSFESTYEELKLSVKSFLSCLSCCFESTYEELKLGLSEIVKGFGLSFESTYEELKLSYEKTAPCTVDVVLSLPMRNWN